MNTVTGALESWGITVRWPQAGWRGLTRRQQVGIVLRTIAQAGLLTVAAWDLHRRPPELVRGTKRRWVPVIAMNYVGAGPLVYLLGGRRRRTADPVG